MIHTKINNKNFLDNFLIYILVVVTILGMLLGLRLILVTLQLKTLQAELVDMGIGEYGPNGFNFSPEYITPDENK